MSQHDDELAAEVARLKAENEALKTKIKNPRSAELSYKVSEKGGISVYGLGRFPVTLYKEQWLRLLDKTPDIQAFIKANEQKLKAKE